MSILLEGLRKRIEKVMNEEQKKAYVFPKDLESVIMFAAKTLDLSINDLVAVPEDDSWLYQAAGH